MSQDTISTSVRRFAVAALDLYRSEREFTITPLEPEELEATIAAFQDLGCTVTVGHAGVLLVRCP